MNGVQENAAERVEVVSRLMKGLNSELKNMEEHAKGSLQNNTFIVKSSTNSFLLEFLNNKNHKSIKSVSA